MGFSKRKNSCFVWDSGGGRNPHIFEKQYDLISQTDTELLFNYYLDVSLVFYYTYKRILAAGKKPRKYIKFCITPPWASLVEIQEWIDEGVSTSILSMDPRTEKLIIPINTNTYPTWTRGAEQWHLLVFDIKNNKWEHYNSDRYGQVGERCAKDSRTMATYCKQSLNTWPENQQRRAEVDCTFIDVKEVA